MANTNSAKGNPASKRMSNKRRAERRQASHNRYEAARAAGRHPKDRRRRANEALHQERMENYGLGRRERRRLLSGVRDRSAWERDRMFLANSN